MNIFCESGIKVGTINIENYQYGDQTWKVAPNLVDKAWYKLKVINNASFPSYAVSAIYRSPVVFKGQGIYSFGSSSGFYSVDGKTKAEFFSGYRYLYIVYFGFDGNALGENFGYPRDGLNEEFEVKLIEGGMTADLLVNSGYGTKVLGRPTSGSLGQICKLNWNALPELTPSNAVIGKSNYTESLFSNLMNYEYHNPNQGDYEFIAQSSDPWVGGLNTGSASNSNGFVGIDVDIYARPRFIEKPDLPNVCFKPFDAYYIPEGIISYSADGTASSKYCVKTDNIIYVGVEEVG